MKWKWKLTYTHLLFNKGMILLQILIEWKQNMNNWLLLLQHTIEFQLIHVHIYILILMMMMMMNVIFNQSYLEHANNITIIIVCVCVCVCWLNFIWLDGGEKNNKIPCGKRNFREKKVEILKPFHHPYMYGCSNLFHYTLIWFALCNWSSDNWTQIK